MPPSNTPHPEALEASGSTAPALALRNVSFVRDRRAILADINWSVAPEERWVVLGPNGSGKSSLLRIAGLYEHPTSGEVEVLGEKLGRVDVRRLRALIGTTSASLGDRFRLDLSPVDIVVTALNGALEPWWHTYNDTERSQARDLLKRFGCAAIADHQLATLSSGERQRVFLARAMMTNPQLLLLDEPTAGLDMAGRESLVADLAGLAQDPQAPPAVLVTHHVEEIPPGFTHMALISDGTINASGPLDDVLTAESLSATFGMALRVERRQGRLWAWAC